MRVVRPKRTILNTRWLLILREYAVALRHWVAHLCNYPTVVIGKLHRHLRRYGIRATVQRAYVSVRTFVAYDRWCILYDTQTARGRSAILAECERLAVKPLISFIMPVWNPPELFLRRAIESVRAQLYPHWELCIADDASTAAHVRTVLEEFAQLDERIRVVWREDNGRISAASNSALAIARGAFVALLDHDDELAEYASYAVAVAINEQPQLDLIYSDEDKIDEEGRRFDPYFKPDWNPDLLSGQNVVCHLGVYRTSLVRTLGGFREGYEGSQDWDLALRVSDAVPASHIYHIPRILYHWRAISGSTATAVGEKPYALTSAEAALRDHLDRARCHGQVSQAVAGYFRVRYAVSDPAPLVSIVIPTRNGLQLLPRNIDSITQKTSYRPYEIIIVDNQSDDTEVLDYLKRLETIGAARILRYDHPFNYSAINNFAVDAARGSFLCLMNNDVEVITEEWLEEMVGQAARPEIGAVGAMLYYPNNTIQHAGVILGLGGVAGHPYAGMPRGFGGYFTRARLVQNLSAVTGACLVVRKTIYQDVGGMDENNLPVAFNDVDFCLRLLERGYRNLWTPFAEFYHHESYSRGRDDTKEKQRRFQKEVAYMRERWSSLLEKDPAYNPNLSLDKSWPMLAFPPRIDPLVQDYLEP